MPSAPVFMCAISLKSYLVTLACSSLTRLSLVTKMGLYQFEYYFRPHVDIEGMASGLGFLKEADAGWLRQPSAKSNRPEPWFGSGCRKIIII